VQAILYTVVVWVLRQVVVKFVVIGAVYALLVILVPMAVGYVAPFIGASSLTSLFAAVPDGVYFFLYFFRLDVGLPLTISAFIAGFLIRRLPLIG
jgi:hypothetical protein